MSRSPTPEARAVQEMLAFRELLASGGLRRIGLGQPDYDPGERLLLRLPQTAPAPTRPRPQRSRRGNVASQAS